MSENDLVNRIQEADCSSALQKDDNEIELIAEHSDNDNDILVGQSKYRFVIAIVYCLVSFANACHWVTFSSCASHFKDNYHLNNFQVDSFSLIYMILYPIVFIPESYIVDNINIRLGVSITAVLTMLGAGIKCFINKGLIYAFIGQFLIAVFQPAILNSPAKIAATWFNEKSRVLVTSLCCVANSIGVLTGYGVHNFFVDPNSSGEQFKSEFQYYLLMEFIGTVICCVPMLIFMKSRPRIPPSKSQNKYVSPPLRENFRILFTNRNFLLLLCSTTCIIGFSNIFGTIINQYLTMYHIPDHQITYIAITGNLCGIGVSLSMSFFLDTNKQYKKNLLTLNCIGFISIVTVTLLLEFIDDSYSIYIAFPLYCLIYMTLVPTFTIAMDYVCEITYPCGESISEGVIMTSNQLSGIIGILICDGFMMFWKEYRYLSNAFGAGLFLISIFSFMAIKERLVRNEKDNEKDHIKHDEDKDTDTEKE